MATAQHQISKQSQKVSEEGKPMRRPHTYTSDPFFAATLPLVQSLCHRVFLLVFAMAPASGITDTPTKHTPSPAPPRWPCKLFTGVSDSSASSEGGTSCPCKEHDSRQSLQAALFVQWLYETLDKLVQTKQIEDRRANRWRRYAGIMRMLGPRLWRRPYGHIGDQVAKHL